MVGLSWGLDIPAPEDQEEEEERLASVSRSLARSLARPLVVHPSHQPTITSLHRHRSTLVAVRFHRVNYGLT